MTTAPRTAALRLAKTQIVPIADRPPVSVRLSILLQRILHRLQAPVRTLFPSPAPAGPPRIPPASAIEVHADADAPGCRRLHVYAECSPVMGDARFRLTPPQVVTLDEAGRGRAIVRAEPKRAVATGRADLRLVVVADDRPEEIAAEISSLQVALTGAPNLVPPAVAGALLIGILVQLVAYQIPVLAVLAIVAVGSIFLSRPTQRMHFSPARLMPLRRRIAVAGAVVGGLALWALLMWAGPEEVTGSWTALWDNGTSMLAAFALFGLLALALAPALQPRAAAGHGLLICTAMAILFYDLTLLPELLEMGDLANALADGYITIGWVFAAVGLIVLRIAWRVPFGRTGIVLAAIGLIALPATFAFGAPDTMTDWFGLLAAAFVLIVSSMTRVALTPALRRRWLREAAYLPGGIALALAFYAADPQSWLAFPAVLSAYAALWTSGEVWLWLRRRRGMKAKTSLSAAGETADSAATVDLSA